MRYVFLVSYDGTDFSGWQKQPRRRTVQAELEHAAGEIFGRETAVSASGRTDAGVHALGQVAQADGACSVPPEKLAACFNRLLPPDVKVLKSGEAPEGFDCTRGAKRKTYRYSAYCSETEQPLLRRYAARLAQSPDISRMREAAALLAGEHDFCAFRAAGYTSKTSVRTIFGVGIGEEQRENATLYTVEVSGNGFLYNMVRILAGELFAVGCGKEEGFTRAFATGAREALAKTMPPEGLCLAEVDYGVPLFGARQDI